jgi:hypothetical protein
VMELAFWQFAVSLKQAMSDVELRYDNDLRSLCYPLRGW